MPRIDLNLQYTLTVDNHELRLITKALGGFLASEDIGPANELSKTISRLRAGMTKSAIESHEKTLKACEATQ